MTSKPICPHCEAHIPRELRDGKVVHVMECDSYDEDDGRYCDVHLIVVACLGPVRVKERREYDHGTAKQRMGLNDHDGNDRSGTDRRDG